MKVRVPSRPQAAAPPRRYAGAPAPRPRPPATTTHRRRAPGRLPTIVLALLTLGVLAWLAVFSPVVRVKHIRVDGVTGALEDATRATAAVVRGKPLLLTGLGSVETAIERDRRVADATVTRRYPDTIVVHVTPRVAILALQNSQGQVDLVDIEGVRFATVPPAAAGVPVVRAAGGTTVGDTALRVALDVIRALPEDLRGRMSDVQVSSADAVTFTIAGTAVTWGNADRSELKARLVAILLSQKPVTIDVSAPDTPITT